MKKVRFLMMIAVAILMGTTMVSCLNSDNESPWDFVGIMNVNNGVYGVSLVSDNGYTFHIVNEPTGLSDLKRGIFYVKLAEGEEFDTEKKTYTNVTFYNYETIITVKNFNQRPDTLESFKITDLSAAWLGGNYINIENTFNYSSSQNLTFDLYAVKAEDNILYAKFNFSKGGSDNAYTPGRTINSFVIPSRYQLQSLLDLQEDGGEIVPDGNDSIQVQIVADGPNGEIKAKTFKIELR